MQTLYSAFGTGAALGVAAWLAAILWLRHRVWSGPVARRAELPADKDFSSDFKYHNEAIYRDFEFFFKVTLALLGGIAYIATKSGPFAPKLLGSLLSAAAGLQLISGILFSSFVFFHQKSKIERWRRRFAWSEPLWWQECWMVSGMLGVSFAIAFSAVPTLLGLLGHSPSTG